jgi:hypothetical protein
MEFRRVKNRLSLLGGEIRRRFRRSAAWWRQKSGVGNGVAELYGPIDAVYTWVDGTDPEFQRQFRRHAPEEVLRDTFAGGERRFRDSEELRYSLRSLETNAPWVNRVFLVTNGQVPQWLNREHPRLQLVTHREIFPNPAHLPTFSSGAIEAHLHRIPGLSSRYLFLNDDMFFGNKVVPVDFLSRSGVPNIWIDPWPLPRSYAGEDLAGHWLVYNRRLLSQVFGDREFSSVAHGPILFDRDCVVEVQAKWPEEFERTSARRFRTKEMVILQILYTHFLAEEKRCELTTLSARRHPFVMFRPPVETTVDALKKLRRERPLFFCINDDWDSDAETKDRALSEFLGDYFPMRSSFERASA